MAGLEVKRGEIWLIDLGMAQKTRPGLILSVEFLDRERALITYVPRTTSMRETRFEVPHHGRGFEVGAFDAQGIGTVPTIKLVRKIGVAEARTLELVEAAVRRWLGL